MTVNSLSINRLINVSVNLSPNAAQTQNINSLLVLGTSGVISTNERFRTYGSLSAVASDFGTSAEEYLAAAAWFGQAPQPTQLLIGRWANVATPASSEMATLPTAGYAAGYAYFTAQPAANDTITVNGTVWTFVSGAPAAFQIQIGALLALTIANAITALSNSTDANTLTMKYSSSAAGYLNFTASAIGTAGNSLTLAKSSSSVILSASTLLGSGATLATWTALTAFSFEVAIDGVPVSVSLTGSPFSAATAITGVAYTIQTALQSALSTAGYAASTSVLCLWNAVYNRFGIYSGTTGTTSLMQLAAAPTATGWVRITVQPTATNTIVLNGTAWTFVSSLTTGNQILLGANVTATLANALATLSASADSNTAKFKYSVVGSYLYLAAAQFGSGGNSLTVTQTIASGATTSGGTLAGAGAVDGTVLMQPVASGVAQGQASETALAATTLFDNNFGQQWYGLFIPDASDSDHQAVGQYIEAGANKHTYWINTTESGVLSSTSYSDIAYVMSRLTLNKSIVQYSSSNGFSVVSLAAKALTINYNGNNTVIDNMYKQEPGVTSEVLNLTQLNTLESKNANVFIAYNNNTTIIEQGNNVSGVPIDIITGIDWLALTIQTAVYNLLYLSSTKIPQTDSGNNLILTSIESVLNQAVADGLLAPGQWTAGGFGALNQGDYLPKGFYVYAPPIATQSAAARSARQSVLFQIAAKLAGAIRTVNIQINVNR